MIDTLPSFQREKDRRMRDLLDAIAVISQPDIICDIGSYNGDEIARFHTKVPSAACHVFEANPNNISEQIGKRTDLDKVIVNNVAVADYDGEISFNILESSTQETKWRRAAGSIYERSDGVGGVKVTVPCTRLDTYFAKQLDADRTFLLWIDVEGALDRLLTGAPRVLSRTIALRAEVERRSFWKGQKLADEIISRIEQAGFLLLGDTHSRDSFGQSDVLFVNREWLNFAVRDTSPGLA